MTARTTCFLWAHAAPRDVEPLIEALVGAFTAFEQKPARMLVTSTRRTKPTAYNGARLTAAMRATDTRGVRVWSQQEVDIDLFLREWRGYEQATDRRHVVLTTPPAAPDDERLVVFLHAACAVYPVAHGGIFRAPSAAHASAEARLILSSQVGDEADRRLSFDSMNATRSLDKLRRLYPVTIVGPELWAKLPPLPDVDPPLVVRDVADCKMITAWPTLTDPHDLQFLLGTRALRRWLWPHTIGNPADDPDEVDRRSKWAELLPW